MSGSGKAALGEPDHDPLRYPVDALRGVPLTHVPLWHGTRTRQTMIRTSEHIAFAFIDTRAAFASSASEWWHMIRMAVSCCNGWQGPSCPIMPRPGSVAW